MIRYSLNTVFEYERVHQGTWDQDTLDKRFLVDFEVIKKTFLCLEHVSKERARAINLCLVKSGIWKDLLGTSGER